MSKKTQVMLDAIGELTYFKEYRKGLQSKALWLLEPFLCQVGKTLGLSLTQVRYLFEDEVVHALQSGKVPDVNARMQFSVYVQTCSNSKMLVAAAAKRFYEKADREDKNLSEVGELCGKCACTGYGKGIVKILLSKDDLHKMRKGNVLVSL